MVSVTEVKRTILITGASRGIGLELARQYLGKGERVIATCRDVEGAGELRALSSDARGQLRIERMDVADTESIEGLAEKLTAEGARIDRLISNAGISGEQPMDDWTAGHFQGILSTNAVGPAMVARAFQSLMVEGGALINVSSGIGSLALNILPEGPLDAYAMSKAALNMLSVRLAEKWRGRNVAVVAMSPGWVKTDMGGEDADLEVGEAVAKLVVLIDGFTMADTGRFVSVEGKDIVW